jgi:DnaJ-domain-containing protein 1
MPEILIGIAVLVIALMLVNGFTKADVKGLSQGARIGRGFAAMVAAARGAFSQSSPTGFARGVRYCAGILVIAGAAFIGVRGQIVTAVWLAAFGASLLGFNPAHWLRHTQRTRGQTSSVRSAFLEMELDHDTGAIRGRIIAGACAGTSLDALELSKLVALHSEFDPESQALLIAYLDRRDPRWREYAQAGETAGEGAARSTGKMSEQEAYQILGLQPGASREEISRAHHALMKKLHPDQGGSTYLAARVNEAKEVLTRRHR